MPQQRSFTGTGVTQHHPAAGGPWVLSGLERQQIAQRQVLALEDRGRLLAAQEALFGAQLERDVDPVEQFQVGVLEEGYEV